MKLHELSPAAGSTRAPKRLGRGPGSGTGKTAGRGHKGQRSRSGYSRRVGFEGGQMPLIRRVPKRGFTNIFRTEYGVVNLSRIAGLVDDAGEDFEGEITLELLIAKGLVRPGSRVKILGDGEIARALKVKAHRFSRSARKKIEAAGGSCEELSS
ncbi:MAG: 50S ribosomal protein L15 [bacterium]|nr:50S ribosomal protein L15 [bacterium]